MVETYLRRLTMKDKRGSILDPIFTSAYLLKITITILISVFVWVSFQTIMEQTIAGEAVESVLQPVMDSLSVAYFSMDYVFPFLVGGLMLISLIFAFKTGANIAYGILSFIFWIVTVLMATVFTNVYLAVSAEFPAIYAAMPIMDIIMVNLKWVALFWIAIISAVMFRKTNAEDDVGRVQGRFYGT